MKRIKRLVEAIDKILNEAKTTNKSTDRYSYSYNEHTRELYVWEDNCILATISDVGKSKKEQEEIFEEVVYELRGFEPDEIL